MTAATIAAPLAKIGPGAAARPRLQQTVTMALARAWSAVKHNPLELVDFSITPIMFVFLFTLRARRPDGRFDAAGRT